MANDSDPNKQPKPADAPDGKPADRLDKPLPMSERELRAVVREIVTEVLEDADQRRVVHSTSMLGGLLQDITATDFDITPKRLALAALAIVVFVVVPMFIVLRPQTVPLPSEIFGSWETSDARYADRGFYLTDSTLTLYRGTQDSLVHNIVRVFGEEDFPGSFTYTIYYTAYATEYELSFRYINADGTIRLVNQPEMTWTKVPGPL